MHTEAIVVFMTAANADEAALIADRLVETRLAACVQILPQIESIYRWQGTVERQTEVLLIVKTLTSRFAALEDTVRKLHSYETPEIVAFPLTTGSKPYLDWLAGSVSLDSELG